MASRIPEKDSDFDQYIRNTTDYLLQSNSPTNWERLGLLQDEMDAWEAFKDEWIVAYPLYTNTATRTKTNTQDKNDIKKDFTEAAQPMLDIMAVCRTINNTDRNTLKIPAPDTTPTERTKIDVSPVVSVVSKTGGRVEIRCRINEDASRASMHPDADGIEVKIKIGAPAPANDTECPLKETFTTAMFDYEAGVENDGKRIYVFARYVNLTDHSKSGDFGTAAYTTVQG